MRFRIGIDVGGTFTDFLVVDESGNFEIWKSPSTPSDPSIGLIHGLGEIAQNKGKTLSEFIKHIDIIVHGTTVTTNTILTLTGAKTALITTSGFRDALQMRRGVREELYNNKYTAPPPLVPRNFRFGVTERTNYLGEIITKVNHTELDNVFRILQEENIEAVAICFMHSYANNENEQITAQRLRNQLPGVYATVSSDLIPQVGFYDRLSTTVLNSYVGPVLERYLNALTQRLEELGYTGVLLIMQSNGGVTTPQQATRVSAATLLSGPAAGPVAGIAYASVHGWDDCITIDMGGTSFDASLVKNRTPMVTSEGDINRYRCALPMVAINTIGAGGGSIGWIDEGGLLRVGPQSAGADPGPACYAKGGKLPTVTDADLILGYINANYFLGGRIALDYKKAWNALKEYIATPLNMTVEEAAAGMFHIVNVNMASGVRQVSIEKGYDPREFPLVVAGGAGPVHAAMIALELEIPTIIIPRASSIFCASGMLLSDIRHDFVRTYHGVFSQMDQEEVENLAAILKLMQREGLNILLKEGVSESQIHYICSADMRYAGQYHEVNIPISPEELQGCRRNAICQRFHEAHDNMYGYCLPDSQIELVNLRVAAVGKTQKPELRYSINQHGETPLKCYREVYIPSKSEFERVPIYDGDQATPGTELQGPLVLEQATTTIFVPPEFNIACDSRGNFIMTLKDSAVKAISEEAP